MKSKFRTHYLSIAGAAIALIGAVLITGLLPGEPASVYGYKKYHYRKPSYKKYIAYCKRTSCGEAKTCKVCAKRDVKAGIKDCRLAYGSEKADCTGGDKACSRTAKQHLKSCGHIVKGQLTAELKQCGQGARSCSHCCSYGKGQNDCSGYFDGTSHPGSYKYKGKVVCPGYRSGSRSGSPSGAFLAQVRAVVQVVLGRSTGRFTTSCDGAT